MSGSVASKSFQHVGVKRACEGHHPLPVWWYRSLSVGVQVTAGRSGLESAKHRDARAFVTCEWISARSEGVAGVRHLLDGASGATRRGKNRIPADGTRHRRSC